MCQRERPLLGANTGEPDPLPDEPGGYTGYQGLFGNKYVAPQISPNGPMTDLNGMSFRTFWHIGFPGFDGTAAVSLSYVAAMQEHGVPVTYAYISDAHDAHPNGPAFGPGSAGYVATLKSYNDAFGKFFTRLAKDGINKSNTLFVFTADEGDHFVGGAPSPAGCDGVTVPCTYSQIGELKTNWLVCWRLSKASLRPSRCIAMTRQTSTSPATLRAPTQPHAPLSRLSGS